MFFRVILYIIIGYYILKLVMRMLAPIMARKIMEKAAKNFEDQFNNPYYKERPVTKEGETRIDKKPDESVTGNNSSQEGEYIDYEEIDD